jgi:hypothetical protein
MLQRVCQSASGRVANALYSLRALSPAARRHEIRSSSPSKLLAPRRNEGLCLGAEFGASSFLLPKAAVETGCFPQEL